MGAELGTNGIEFIGPALVDVVSDAPASAMAPLMFALLNSIAYKHKFKNTNQRHAANYTWNRGTKEPHSFLGSM